eukprot:CAMPEP_0116896780 /NCGR_PEP_ID=MMETSP0467-20121206/5947_1 /TAXON_ID=283647 /ORGANISM="Mesodinium pulex, Strain SPMC105" /LENGTH=61 /DNA_ID=CAMNT_0004568139 /DNA_START=460 /DNA_END=645 /DNA_ORIENTATION=-
MTKSLLIAREFLLRMLIMSELLSPFPLEDESLCISMIKSYYPSTCSNVELVKELTQLLKSC